MKINFYLLFTVLLLSFSACTDPEPPIEEEEKEVFELIYPSVGADIDYCCFAFQWNDPNDEGTYQLQLASESSFDNLLLDTIISEQSFDFPSFLYPGRTYYWRIIPDDMEQTKSAEFEIFDYPKHLRGSYKATINKYSWLLLGETSDTTFQTYIYLTEGDNNSFSYSSPDYAGEENIPFSEELNDAFVKYEVDHSYPGNIDYIKYFFENDSLVAYYESGANGGGGHNLITAKINE